jgi:hypothetical protein
VRVKLASHTIKLLGIRRRIAFDCNIWPFGRVFGIDFEPSIKPWFGVRLNGVRRAFRLTNATVDAFIRVDHQHVFAFVKAIHGAHFHAVHIFTFNAVFRDDVGHNNPLLRGVGGRDSRVFGIMHPFFRVLVQR